MKTKKINNFLKNNFGVGCQELIILAVIIATALFFLFVPPSKAGSLWFSAYNFGVCTAGVDISNPEWPIIKWQTLGAGICNYGLQISDDKNFENLLINTGIEFIGSGFQYSLGGLIGGHWIDTLYWQSSPRCPGDNNSHIADVPPSFSLSEDIGQCYDWFDFIIPPSDLLPADPDRCSNGEEGCYINDFGFCSCGYYSMSAQYIYSASEYLPTSQTSFTYLTYLPRGKTYYYRVNVSNCGDYRAGDLIWHPDFGWSEFLLWSGWAEDSFYTPPMVINNPPVVSNPRIIPGSDDCANGINSANATFAWDYSDPDGDAQQSYRIDGSLDTDRVYSGSHSHALSLACGTTYSLRVRAWDTYNNESSPTGYVSYTTPPLNHKPAAYNLQTYQIGDYCSVGPHASFSWNYTDVDGDTENSWQIQVDDNQFFNNPEADSCSPLPGTCASGNTSNSFSTTNLQYNKSYHWRVRVWDSKGLASDWVNGSDFSTPKHRYPTIDFSWSPALPIADENVSFYDNSTAYGGAGKSAWSWVFQDGIPDSSVQQNPTIQFSSGGNKQVSLMVTDSDGYACTGYKQVNVNLFLPKWKEIIPR